MLIQPTPGVDLVRLGTAYGGWWVPTAAVRPGRTAYCAGAGTDISFDTELVERGMHVVVFDPTPVSIEHVEEHAPKSELFEFIPVGWWESDEILRFHTPIDPTHVSHSVVNLQKTNTFFEAPVTTVANVMRKRGDTHLSIVKMDIEGAEFAVIESMLRDGVRPDVLCVEYDQPTTTASVVRSVRGLEAAGYVLRHVEQWNYTFTYDRTTSDAG